MKIVYIASPYTIGDKDINIFTQMETANKLMDLGFCPIVPLFTHFQNKLFSRPNKDWQEIDFLKIEMCDCLLRLPGECKDADLEVKYARSLLIPVYFSIEVLKNEI